MRFSEPVPKTPTHQQLHRIVCTTCVSACWSAKARTQSSATKRACCRDERPTRWLHATRHVPWDRTLPPSRQQKTIRRREPEKHTNEPLSPSVPHTFHPRDERSGDTKAHQPGTGTISSPTRKRGPLLLYHVADSRQKIFQKKERWDQTGGEGPEPRWDQNHKLALRQ